MPSARLLVVLVVLPLLALACPAQALEPDQLLLVVNKNVREGQALAEYYAAARHVPEGRIVALDLPVGDEIAFARYEADVVPVLRAYLKEHQLEQKVTCIVTFYGVPLRIPQRQLTPAEADELKQIRQQLDATAARVETLVQALEAKAQEIDRSFRPTVGKRELPLLTQRLGAASRPIMALFSANGDAKLQALLVDTMQEVSGAAGIVRGTRPPEGTAPEQVAEQQRWQKLAQQVRQGQEEIRSIEGKRADPEARQRLRTAVRDSFGLLEYARLLGSQIDYLAFENSTAALDSELALLWWDYYGRGGFAPNPLHYRARPAPTPRVLMVSRLDAPQSGLVKRMIDLSLKAEHDGLKGIVVLDGRGMRAESGKEQDPGGYAGYDQSIRNLATLIRGKTKLQMLYDDSDKLLPADSARDVALYCGWYSVRKYVACCKFGPGAVGYHVASEELISMQDPTGWVHGLLTDGISATLGPVAEPFLFSFPPADDFFPLLLTGKLSLAEVYWKTQLSIRWRQVLVGDPLYTPYKNAPALRVEDLPPKLAGVFKPPASAPAP